MQQLHHVKRLADRLFSAAEYEHNSQRRCPSATVFHMFRDLLNHLVNEIGEQLLSRQDPANSWHEPPDQATDVFQRWFRNCLSGAIFRCRRHGRRILVDKPVRCGPREPVRTQIFRLSASASAADKDELHCAQPFSQTAP